MLTIEVHPMLSYDLRYGLGSTLGAQVNFLFYCWDVEEMLTFHILTGGEE